MGEEEAGSQPRSPMWDLIPERQDHALSRRQMLKYCITQAPLFIYLRERKRARKRTKGGAEGEADSPLSREPEVGLDPRTLGL